jgi:alpha-1,2-mannosyltransferase
MVDASTTVLAAMGDDRGAARHGLDLLRETGMASGTLYPTLIRLQRTGLVEADWQDGRRTYRRMPGEPGRAPAPGAAGAETAGRAPIAWWLPAMLVAAVTAYGALTRPAAIRLSDLGVYVGAVGGLRHGSSLYDFISAGHAPFTYPPFAGLLFWPLTWAPTLPLQVAWTLATIAAVGWIAHVVTPRRMSVPILGLILMISAPVSSDIRYGQVSVFLAAVVAVDVLRPSHRQGVLIGLAAAIKLTPLIFIPMLWLAGRRAAAATAAGTFATAGVLAAIVLPGDSLRFWTVELSHVSRLGYITSVGNQSLNGALMRFEVSAPWRSAAVLIIGGGVAAIALRRAARLGRAGDWLSALAVAGAASIVLSPVSWTHHQVWLVLAALLPVRGPAWVRHVWTAGVLAIMLLPVTALGSPPCNNARLLMAVVIAAALPLASGSGTRASRPGTRALPLMTGRATGGLFPSRNGPA